MTSNVLAKAVEGAESDPTSPTITLCSDTQPGFYLYKISLGATMFSIRLSRADVQKFSLQSLSSLARHH